MIGNEDQSMLQKQLEEWVEADSKLYKQPGDSWTVDWLLKVETEAEHEIETIKANAEAQIKRVESRVSAAKYRYGDIAEREAKIMLANEKKRKSVILSHGKIGYRKKLARVEVVNPKETYDWINENLGAEIAETSVEVNAKELVKNCSIEQVRKAVTGIKVMALNNHFRESGEQPSGCEVVPESEKFYMKGGK
jgi:phage host-nuclease inhibitor protein Gam